MLDPRSVLAPHNNFNYFFSDAPTTSTAELRHTVIGSSMATTFAGPAHRLYRTPEQVADGRDWVAIAYTKVGRSFVHQDGRSSVNVPGSLVFYRTNAPFNYFAVRAGSSAGFVTQRTNLPAARRDC